MKINDRVLCFDNTAFIDDETTPLAVTMKPATIIAANPKTHFGRMIWVYDIRFNDGRVSKGHFKTSLEAMK